MKQLAVILALFVMGCASTAPIETTTTPTTDDLSFGNVITWNHTHLYVMNATSAIYEYRHPWNTEWVAYVVRINQGMQSTLIKRGDYCFTGVPTVYRGITAMQYQQCECSVVEELQRQIREAIDASSVVTLNEI